MANGFRGRPGSGRGYNKPAKNIGRGVLSDISTDGPHTEWLGMPPFYIHQLTIDNIVYTYFSPEQTLTVDIGKTVTFRYSQTKKGLVIDKKSLGLVIDPSELN